MRKMKSIGLSLGVVLAAGGLFANVIFTDTFVNGVSTDSDSESGFWTESQSASGAYRNIQETGGTLTLSAGQSSGTATSFTQIQSGIDSRFSFLSSGLVFQSDTLVTSDATLPATGGSMRFMVSASTGTLTAVSDAIYLTYKEDNTGFLYLKNSGSVSTLKSFSLTDTITSFSLTLNSNAYDLTLHTTGSDYTASGSYNLTGDWSNGSALTLMAVTSGAIGQGNVTFDNFSVTTIPEPATLSLIILSMGVAFGCRPAFRSF
jgi:hypothetical protein